jgi:signal transduction histidine kinase
MMEKTSKSEETAAVKKQIAVAAVHASAAGLGAVLGQTKSDSERTRFLRAYVNAIRFFSDETGYFFVYNMEGLNIALPNPKEWEGKNLLDHKDSKEQLVIKNLIDLAQKKGGFLEYYWVKPGAKGEKKKIAYVEPIPNTNYFIGTGYYPD